MTTTTPTAETVTCHCTHCTDHATRTGKTLPLTVEVPALFANGLPRGKRGGFSKMLRHNLVHMGHDSAAISRACRERNGIRPVA